MGDTMSYDMYNNTSADPLWLAALAQRRCLLGYNNTCFISKPTETRRNRVTMSKPSKIYNLNDVQIERSNLVQ